MRKVFPRSDTAKSICDAQRVLPEERYRLTTDCVQVPCEDGTLYYHTLTGELLLLEPNEQIGDNREELIRSRFLVPESHNELQYTLQVRRILTLLHTRKRAVTNFTILPTTDCNARCFYCYEQNSRRITMSETTALDTADYIATACAGEDVSICWFGGEPLYNISAIDLIAEHLIERGVTFTSQIVTNAYLFDEDTVERAVAKWHLKKAQITLDGTKERYQRTKAYIYHDDNAYERVLDNIDCLLRHGVRVTVRLNLNRKNSDDLLLLCDELAARFSGKEGLTVYPHLLKEFAGKVDAFEDEAEAAEMMLKLKDKLKNNSFLFTTPLVRDIAFQRCMADSDKCEVIMPDGSVGKCEHFSESEFIGTIYSPRRDKALIQSWKEQILYPECNGCPLAPRCIELKKCAWAKDGCSKRVRRLRLEKLCRQIAAAYHLQKGKTECSE